MKICYLAHPVGGDVENNLALIRRIVREVNLEHPEVVPFVPYYSDVVSLCDAHPSERARGIKNNTHILKSGIVNELWLYGDKISAGMAGEIEIAKEMGIKIVPMSKEIKEIYTQHA